MARIRSIKPDAFTSESLSSVDYFTRWTFAGLWTYFDDQGYGRGDVRLIKAALFPLDDDASVGKVTKALDALTEAGCLCRYVVEGRNYLHAPNWKSHQKVNRPTDSKFPQCPEHGNGPSGEVVTITHGSLSDGSLTAHLRKGTGNREQGTGKRDAARVSEFDDFWDIYPRKTSKADALKAWAKAVKTTEPATILDGLRLHLPALSVSEVKFIPYPATWLNGERWADDVKAAPAQPPSRGAQPEGW